MAHPCWRVTESAVLQALREQALMIKFFSCHATAVSTEETCRAVVRAAPQAFSVDSGGPFHAICQHLLMASGCQQYADPFEVMRLSRNTIHTNGVYRPQKPQNRTITYGGARLRSRSVRLLTGYVCVIMSSRRAAHLERCLYGRRPTHLPLGTRGNSKAGVKRRGSTASERYTGP